ncbi:MAG: hypothetical protein WCT20_02435 [Candidatus Babeliales bacterium]
MKIKNLHFLAVGFVISFVSLQAGVNSVETRGLFSFLTGEKKEVVKIEQPIAPVQKEQAAPQPVKKADPIVAEKDDVDAILANLDSISENALRCGNCTSPKKIKACEVCAKRIYTMCLFADVAKIKDLFVKREKVEKIWTYVVYTCKLCAHKAKIDHLWSDKAYIECAKIEKLCADHGDIDKLKADHLWTHKLCAKDAWINDLYTKNFCSKYRATVAYNNPFIGFNLGDKIKFDSIIDDPNGNVDNSGASTKYIAPVSGYYTMTLQLDFSNLRGGSIITGQPTAHLAFKVNDVFRVHSDFAILTFNNWQNSTVSSLIHLNAGDVVETELDVFIMDPNVGFKLYPGQVDFSNAVSPIAPVAVSFFMIHNLSADCVIGDHCPPPPCNPCHCEGHECDFGHEDCNLPCPNIHSDCHDDCNDDHHEGCHNEHHDDHHEDCDDHFNDDRHGHGTTPTIVINYDSAHGHNGWRNNRVSKPVAAPAPAIAKPEEEVVSMDDLNWAFENENENTVAPEAVPAAVPTNIVNA